MTPPEKDEVERHLRAEATDFRQYQNDPVAYADVVLQVHWWAKQREIAEALVQHGRVFVKAGNGPGKTFLAASLVNWFYDCFRPGKCLTTAPTQAQVNEALWSEVRMQRPGRSDMQPKAARMEDAPDHFAVGYTASTSEAFQGRHSQNVFIIFDEATAIDREFWIAGEGMQPRFWLVLLNPTATDSIAYEEEQSGKWHVITLNGLEHPNVLAELSGLPRPYPEASLTLDWVRERVEAWCTPVAAADHRSHDIEFEGAWYKPGSLFESRVLGRWPSQGSTSVWTEAMWNAALRLQVLDATAPLEIGCDVARFGDDFTSIVARRGLSVLHHETHNGWDTAQTAGRLKQLAEKFHAGAHEPAKKVPIKVDDDGVGGGVIDQRGDFNFVDIKASNRALVPAEYPNRRSEMWFVTAEQADEGRLDLSRLGAESVKLLRRQLMAPTWKVDSQGRRVVEPKADTKKRIGRSPDDADALNLAFAYAPVLKISPELHQAFWNRADVDEDSALTDFLAR